MEQLISGIHVVKNPANDLLGSATYASPIVPTVVVESHNLKHGTRLLGYITCLGSLGTWTDEPDRTYRNPYVNRTSSKLPFTLFYPYNYVLHTISENVSRSSSTEKSPDKALPPRLTYTCMYSNNESSSLCIINICSYQWRADVKTVST